MLLSLSGGWKGIHRALPDILGHLTMTQQSPLGRGTGALCPPRATVLTRGHGSHLESKFTPRAVVRT